MLSALGLNAAQVRSRWLCQLVFLSQWLAALAQPAVGEAGWAVMDEVPSLHDSKRKA